MRAKIKSRVLFISLLCLSVVLITVYNFIEDILNIWKNFDQINYQTL